MPVFALFLLFSLHFLIKNFLLQFANPHCKSTSYILPANYFLPTNHTNLHESLLCVFNGDLYGRTNFHEFNIYGCALDCISVISATEQVAIYFIENVSCSFV